MESQSYTGPAQRGGPEKSDEYILYILQTVPDRSRIDIHLYWYVSPPWEPIHSDRIGRCFGARYAPWGLFSRVEEVKVGGQVSVALAAKLQDMTFHNRASIRVGQAGGTRVVQVRRRFGPTTVRYPRFEAVTER